MSKINRDFFFSNTRQALFGKFSQSQVEGLTAILDEWEKNYSSKDDRWLAYMLATAFHETAVRMKPIEEFGKGKGRPYGKKLKMSRQSYSVPNQIYYGRGFVQLTWYENYENAGTKLGVNLLNNPGLALDLKIATQIMFLGMIEGWFTGKKLSDYINDKVENLVNARRIINGNDRDKLIANYALKFYSSISYTK